MSDYSVIQGNVIEVLEADSKLGSGGSLALATTRQRHLENVEEYSTIGLPAASVEAHFLSSSKEPIGSQTVREFQISIVLVVEGYDYRTTKQELKRYAARIERVMSEQYEADKQLNNLPSEIAADSGSVQVMVNAVIMDTRAVGNANRFRGVAEVAATLTIGFTEPTDAVTVGTPSTSYSGDDLYNIAAEFVIKALQEDTEMGSGGDYEVNTWEQEHREDYGSYMDYQLPAVSAEVTLSSQSVEQISGETQVGILGTVVVTREARDLPTLKSDLAEHSARVERMLVEQNLPTRQMARMPEVISGADGGTLAVNVLDIETTVGEAGHRFKGFSEVQFQMAFGLTY